MSLELFRASAVWLRSRGYLAEIAERALDKPAAAGNKCDAAPAPEERELSNLEHAPESTLANGPLGGTSPNSNQTQAFQPNRYLLRGTAWFVTLRWSVRGIGLISTLILARLLTPDDFGLYTMATLIAGFVAIFGDSGQILALIRHPNPTREHYDTAWTMGVAMGAIVAAAVALSAPFAVILFNEPRAVPLVLMLSLRTLISGFENIGIVAFRRDFEFRREFVYLIMCKILPFLLLLGGAFLLHNYWAFAIGSVGGRLLSVAFSYWLNSYRPRLSLSRFHELWNFSAWMLAVSLGEQMNARFEEFVVGWLFGTRAMGLYNVALDLAYSPTDELVQPLNRNLFNVYAKMHHDKAQLAAHYRSVLSGIATVCFSTAIGVSLVAPDFVAVVLGPQWAAAVPLIVCLALGQALDPALTSMSAVLNVTGASRRSTALTWTRTSLVVPFAVLFGYVWGIEGIAWARVAVIFLMLPVFLWGICATIPIGYREVLAQFWRPALSSACMAIIVIGLSPYFSGLPPMAALALRAVAGAAVFIMVSVLLWRLAGQPEGIEAIWLALCRNKVRNIRASAIP